MIDKYIGKKIISPLDFAAINSLNDPSQDETGELGEVKSIHLITDSKFIPGFDLMIRFKNSDSRFNNLRLSFRIRKETDTPGVVKPRRMLIGYSAQRNEVQVVNHILLSFSRPAVISEFLSNLSSHFASLSEVVDADPGIKPEKL